MLKKTTLISLILIHTTGCVDNYNPENNVNTTTNSAAIGSGNKAFSLTSKVVGLRSITPTSLKIAQNSQATFQVLAKSKGVSLDSINDCKVRQLYFF
ncbi:hypothetical protein PSECIP111951_00692 [Pseudoalteromonas holothuriae]|uniref:Uncharacterized protein n=1 Tax=Pseudoalteromonas holothuriae TaxID=2963714 RepID=A0ABN8UIC6_9GAMM|nr:hypothetical protein PSECIP111951_00692 [Pseudoalteromonas sp. CIP111951]